jgi:hypothetical protein
MSNPVFQARKQARATKNARRQNRRAFTIPEAVGVYFFRVYSIVNRA